MGCGCGKGWRVRLVEEGQTVMVLVMTKIADKDDDKAGGGVELITGLMLSSG